MLTTFKQITADTEQVLEKIDALDLEPIKFKLMNPEEGNGWTLELCDEVEIEYKKYLKLCYLYPNQAIVPSRQQDKMWHTHILDTRKYLEDCQSTFGYFVHHYPYFGERSKDDKQDLNQSFKVTQFLNNSHFGISNTKNSLESSKCNTVCGDGYIEASVCNNGPCAVCKSSCSSDEPTIVEKTLLSRPRPTR
jgi:hypothetical protein